MMLSRHGKQDAVYEATAGVKLHAVLQETFFYKQKEYTLK